MLVQYREITVEELWHSSRRFYPSKKHFKLCKWWIINTSDIGLCVGLPALIRDTLITVAFPGLCNHLGTLACKAQQILKEANLIQNAHGTSGSLPNVGTLTGNENARHISWISSRTCQNQSLECLKGRLLPTRWQHWSDLLLPRLVCGTRGLCLRRGEASKCKPKSSTSAFTVLQPFKINDLAQCTGSYKRLHLMTCHVIWEVFAESALLFKGGDWIRGKGETEGLGLGVIF